MSSVSASESVGSKKHTDHTWGQDQENTTGTRAGKKKAVFDTPEGQSALAYLQDTGPITSEYTGQVADTYGRLAKNNRQVNPYVDQIIKTGNMESDRGFQDQLGKTRGGAYGGGSGNGLYDTGKLMSGYGNQQKAQNAGLRYGAFEDAQGLGQQANVSGAAGLAGLRESDVNQQMAQKNIATRLLALLRGENVDDTLDSGVGRKYTTGASGRASSKDTSISGTYSGGGGG